jgi:hypothetical protein
VQAGAALVDPALVDPALVDPALVDPALVDPALVDAAPLDTVLPVDAEPLAAPVSATMGMASGGP